MNLKRVVIYASAFLIPPIIINKLLTFATLSTLMLHQTPAPLPSPLAKAAAPAAKSGKPGAAILMANDGTQLTELFGAYEVLSESGAFDVYTVAPETTPSSTTGAVAVVPRYSFAQLAELPAPELLVIPSVLDPNNAKLQEFVREQAKKAKLVVLLGEGARLAAAARLLPNHFVTTHFLALENLKAAQPDAQWIQGPRYLEDHGLVSSQGITATLDASLYAIEKLAGKAVAETTAKNLGYAWQKEAHPEADPATLTNAPEGPRISATDFLQLFVRGGYDWTKGQAAVLLYPGVSEMAVAAPLEVFARTHSYYALTVASRRELVLSRHGMALVPTESADSALPAELLIVPAAAGDATAAQVKRDPNQDPQKDPLVQRWIAARDTHVKSFLFDAPGAAYERMLTVLSELQGRRIAAFVAKMIRYEPAEKLPLRTTTPDWPISLLVKPLLIGVLGVLLAAWIERRVQVVFRSQKGSQDTGRKR